MRGPKQEPAILPPLLFWGPSCWQAVNYWTTAELKASWPFFLFPSFARASVNDLVANAHPPPPPRSFCIPLPHPSLASSPAAKAKVIKRGVKEVVKAVRKGGLGEAVCIIAGDISPIDVICHLPILCEEADIPYIYVPSKAELGEAASSKRPTSCILVVPGKDFSSKDLFDEAVAKVAKMAPTF